MARYQIILAYDGTDFYGSQRQGKARTVQSELERALRKIGWNGRSVLLAGRTDTGVHATGQVAAFDLEWGHSPTDLVKALNANLPGDLAVWWAQQVNDAFHPRFDARSRRYRYRLFCQEERHPLRERYAWRVWPPVNDLTALANLWLGTHDFAAFGSPTTPRGSTVRTVYAASWQTDGDEWLFEIEANAFLYRMIRRLVYLQVAVGQGRLPVESLAWTLDAGSPVREETHPSLPGGLAPPNGLSLVEIKYDNLVELV
jgi:tRNA pseudouridine38-40 synthase